VQDETVYIYGYTRERINEPVLIRTAIVPDENGDEAGVHWLRGTP